MSFDDIGGNEDIKQQICELVEWPILYPQLFQQLGVKRNHSFFLFFPKKKITEKKKKKATCGILVHGPAGCGKSLIVNALANEICSRLKTLRSENLSFYKISAPQLISSMSGESESNIRNLFQQAKV